MCTFWSASTILVLETFSIVYFVLPLFPARRPTALAKWSPLSDFTSVTSNVSRKRSSSLKRANASSISNPITNALMKSAAFWTLAMSSVSFHVLISTFLALMLKRIWSLRCSTIGVKIFIQFSFNGVNLCLGIGFCGFLMVSPFSPQGRWGPGLDSWGIHLHGIVWKETSKRGHPWILFLKTH